MSTQSATNRTALYTIGWVTLLALTVLFSVWHIALTFMDNDPLLIAWVAFPLYAALVLYFPFRRGEKWAWYASWILVLGFAGPILFQTMFGIYYLGIAVVMALALLLTLPAFRQQNSAG